MDALRYYMDGPGEVLIMTSDFDPGTPDLEKVICSMTCKTAAFRGGVTQENVTGGRGLFPKRKYLTERNVTFELEDCEMDFRYVSISQGEDINIAATTVYAFGEDFAYTINSSTGVATLGETPLDGTLVVQFADGTLCTEAATPSTTGQYSLSGKTLTFSTADKGKDINTFFQYTSDAATKTVSTLSDSLPKTVKVIHKQPTFDNDNVITGYQFIEIFKLQPSGEFEEAYAEKQAFAPKLTFELVDPKRADKKVVDHKWVPVAAA